MNLLRCANGHFYDADKYSKCPHCEELKQHDVTVTIPMEIQDPGSLDVTEPLTAELPISGNGPSDIGGFNPIDPGAIYGGPEVTDNDEVTVGYYQDLIAKEPVVGFLICTKGEYFGEEFKLKTGRNFVGRSAAMDVVLDMDPAVSRERHAIIVYEPRSRTFFAQNGDSHGMFYVNDKVILSNEVLKAYDRISLGNTELLFIPVCGPDFTWDNEKK